MTEDTEFKHRVIATLNAMKFEFHDRPSELMIPVYGGGKPVAYLRPVPDRLEGVAARDAELITEWRNQYRESFLTWFTATEEQTRKWLMEQVITKEDRILFMVQTVDAVPIGHMGLTNFDFSRRCCEHDYLVRGRFTGPPEAIILAEKALLDWIFSELKIRKVIARVFSDNYPVIKLHESCGFKVIKHVPLRQIEETDCTRWVEATEETSADVETYLAYMEADSPLKSEGE